MAVQTPTSAQPQDPMPIEPSVPPAPVAPAPASIPLAAQPAIVEYNALRDELLRRIDSRQQSLSMILGLASGFLGIGWGAGAMVLMIYPVLALLLAAAWSQNEVRISELSAYLAEVEARLPGMGWETYYRSKDKGNLLAVLPLEMLAAAGILFVTQWLAFGLGVYQLQQGTQLIHWIMLVIDLAAMVALMALVVYIVRRVRALNGA